MKPLVSIVIPVYGVPEQNLRKCIESIVNQTSNNFEAIFVDDGSPDNCGLICDEYSKSNSNFITIHQNNSGVSVARNTGIENAKGDWITFVDGDDWIESNTVEFIEDYVEQCKDGDILIWDILYDVDDISNRNCFLPDYINNELSSFSDKEKEIIIDGFFPRYYRKKRGNYVDLGVLHAKAYKTDFLKTKEIKFVVGLRRMQDNVFNLYSIENADKIYYKCERLYHYCFNSLAVTQRYSSDNVDTMCFLYEKIKDYINKYHFNDYDFKQRLYCRFIRIFGEIFKLNYANPKNKKN